MSIRDLTPWWGRRGAAARGEADNPFAVMQREMDRLFENFGRGVDLPAPSGDGWLTPSLDVAETNGEYRIAVELPGVEEKDVDVSLADGVLTIKGEKKSEKEEKDKNFYRVERSYGRFQRSLMLPAEIDADKVKADFAKGVLTITVPKKPEAKSQAKRIEVKAG